ncbi:MAG: CPBP family intramembrane glutamic endopeptidase [Bacteroidota bacterium]
MHLRNTYTNLHPGIRLLIIFTVVFIGLFFSQVFSGVIILLSTSSDMAVNMYCLENINVNILKVVQSINTIFSFLIPAYIIAFISHPDPSYHLRISKKISSRNTIMTIVLMISGIAFINLLAQWNSSLSLPESMEAVENIMKNMEESAQRLQERILDVNNAVGLFINLIVIAIIPAISEEVLFRGIIQRTLRQWTQNIHVAIIITGFLFSFVHFQFYGFIPRMFLGVIFGYLLYWTGNLWVPILAHFVNNAIATIWYYFYFRNEKTVPDPDEFGASGDSAFLYISTVMFIAIVYFYFYRRRKTSDKRKE